jgi:hypothetical protein
MALISLTAGIVSAGTSTQSITYQGKMTDAAGHPLTGTYQAIFNLYGVPNSGVALDTDTHKIGVDNGLFTTTLTFDSAYFDGRALWLGIRMGTDAEMTPRQEIRPVPYALNLVPATTTRTISFPANALNYPNESSQSVIRQFGNGLRWRPSGSGGAFLELMKPADWDGTSDVTLSIYFITETATSGSVDFFIRPRSFNSGDSLYDVVGQTSTPVAVSSRYLIKKQTFTIPAASLTKELWYITIQNHGPGSTYPDDVTVLSVGLTYNAIR